MIPVPKKSINTWSDWLCLNQVPGVGNLLFKRLIDSLQTPANVFLSAREKPDRLHRVEGVSHHLIDSIARFQPSDGIKREVDHILSAGFTLVTMADKAYPSLLLEIPDPPPYLYVAGALPETVKNIALVGSRNATSYGLSAARKLSFDLANRGSVIVSGMALGIDTAAHMGAISANGKTVAVLGSGLSRIYPAQNRQLFERIVEIGGVISEFPMTAGPEAHHFPRRNRIISGMSLGTVVVEATRRSGSLITARLAGEQNRDVFAVPGSIQSFKSTGTHTLIKQGAKLVENAQDVIEEFPRFFGLSSRNRQPAASLPELSDDEKKIFDSLDAYPTHIDELALRTQLDAGHLSSLLMQMELAGLISQAPGKMFTRHVDYC
jgi:DNA processing protein